MTIEFCDILAYKYSHAEWATTGPNYEDIVWHSTDIPKPRKATLLNLFDEYELHLQNIEYKAKRAAEYPSIEDQLDTIYHYGIDAWKSEIADIKAKYPKPN